MNPIFRWAGSKLQLVHEIEKLSPKSKKYFEPFLGGGSVFFHLQEKRDYKYIWLNDINDKLITTYRIIQNRPQDLIDNCKKLKKNYDNKDYNIQKNFFLNKRTKFNKNLNTINSLETATNFLFLIQTCYDGIYRTNLTGEFNNSFSQKDIFYINEEQILNGSKALQKAKINCGNYYECANFVDKNSFVFLDPPYYNREYDYFNKGIEEINLKKLFSFCCYLDDLGAKFILCNSKHKDVKNIFEKEFFIKEVETTRIISQKKTVKEYMILNYNK